MLPGPRVTAAVWWPFFDVKGISAPHWTAARFGFGLHVAQGADGPGGELAACGDSTPDAGGSVGSLYLDQPGRRAGGHQHKAPQVYDARGFVW